jgi:hypothetical protein
VIILAMVNPCQWKEAVQVFGSNAIVQALLDPTTDYSDNIRMELHSHFSDESKQNASTTHTHMEVLLNYLKSERCILPGSTMWDDTDGCSK